VQHEKDLELARACERGDEAAWDRFIAEYRPVLYRSADAIDPSGNAREIADSLYAELYGLKEKDGKRKSLFAYYQGRSSLATWLRAILAQRFVDRIRATKRLEELPDEESFNTIVRHDRSARPFDTAVHDRSTIVPQVLGEVIAALEPRDRLRLGCYYAQEMTLVQIGKLTKESEATVSRQLAKTRRAIRDEVERRLREEHRFGEAEIRECFAAAVEDSGELDLAALLRKESADDRSKVGEVR
jgi:RNA polymerase sigma-70 factor (ECF subfamily)